jgi:hypothetical protein
MIAKNLLCHFLVKEVLLFSLFILTLTGNSAFAYDARLLSLNNPTLSHTAAAPPGFSDLVFPTDEFGFGISAVPDTLDIWKFPQAIVDKELFPSHTIILDYISSTDGNGGIVVGIGKLPLAVGVFLMRPNRNGWVIGRPRSELSNLGSTFASDAGNAVSTFGSPPGSPTNFADLMVAVRFGMFLFGAGVGYSYEYTIDSAGESIAGNPDSEIKEDSRTSVITIRLGASVKLNEFFPLSIDLGALGLFSTYHAEYDSGSAAVPLPNVSNAEIMAENIAFSVGGRLTWTIVSNLDLLVLIEYADLPQKYEGNDDSGNSLDTTTTRIDPVMFTSFSSGLGANWTPLDTVFVNALLTLTFGSGEWTEEAPGAGPRDADNVTWTTLRGVIDGEFTLDSWLILRGGVGGSYYMFRRELKGGTDYEYTSTDIIPSASAGLGILIMDRITLDLALNLSNFTEVALFQTLAVQASLEARL